jgi:5-methylcytosine-specific restriction protein A
MQSKTASASPTPRTTGGKWMAIRERQLRACPHCVMCMAKGLVTPAREVDHIIPLSKGGTDAQIQSLCIPHHLEKTKQDMKWD